MATARIILQQSGDGYSTPTSRDDLVLSLPVTVLNQDNSGVTSWSWTIVDKPSGSTASFASPTSSTTTFTPDIVGTYLIKLAVNAGAAVDQKGAGIKTAKLQYRIPAATETTEFDGYRGWATAANFALKILDDGYSPSVTSTLQSVYNNSSPSLFTLNSTNGGFQIHDSQAGIGANILEVDAYGNGTKYFTVSASQISVNGIFGQTGGLVGLGTLTPASGYAIAPDIITHILKANHNLLLVETQTASSDAGIAFFASSADSSIFIDDSDSDKLKFSLGNVDTHTSRQTNTKLTIQQNGAVGIGTTSPSAQLHVVGTGRYTGQLTLDAGFSAGAASSMNNFKIVSLATPTTGTDAATKAYVDSQVAGASGTLQSIYVNSTPAEILLNPTNDTLIISAPQTPFSSMHNLFEIDAYGGSSFFSVSSAAANVSALTGSAQTQNLPAGAGSGFVAIYGNSPINIYAGGTAGSTPTPVFHSTGNGTWTNVSTWPGGGSDKVSSIWVDSTGRVYVSVNNGSGVGALYITINGGATWTAPATFTGIATYYVWGVDDTHVYAAAGSTPGSVAMYISANNGVSWTTLTTIGDQVNQIYGASTTDIFATTGVSGSGAIWRSTNGTSFSQVFTVSALSLVGNINGFWGLGSNYYAGGGDTNGFIIHSTNGTSWSLQNIDLTAAPIQSMYGTASNDIYAVSTNTAAGHKIFHSTGHGEWFIVPDGGISAGIEPYKIWGSAYNDFYVTLYSGRILHLAPTGGDLFVHGALSIAGTIINPGTPSIGETLIYNGSYFTSQFAATTLQSAYDLGIDGYAGNISANVSFDPIAFIMAGGQTTQRNGLLLKNTTASGVSGTPSYSPSIELQGRAGDAGTSETDASVFIDNRPLYLGDGYGPVNKLFISSGWGGTNLIDLLSLTTTNSPSTPLILKAEDNGSFEFIGSTFRSTTLLTVQDANFGNATRFSIDASGNATVSGNIIVDGYTINPANAAIGQALVYNGSSYVPGNVSGGGGSVADSANLLLTTTSATTVISYNIASVGNYVVYVYYTVSNAPTDINITISWLDPTGNQSYTAVNFTTQSLGSYNVAPIYIDVTVGDPIVITATAGTANNVAVSASIATLDSTNPGSNTNKIDEKSNNFDRQLTNTSSTTIATFTPVTNGNFVCFVYYRVANATTNVTLNIAWTDNGGSQTFPLLSLTSKTVGSYSTAPTYIQATTAGAIVVSATGGTANNVFVSATIISV